jgi:hypothetical protein
MRVGRYLETIEWRGKWIENDRKGILGWLKRNGYLRPRRTWKGRWRRVVTNLLVWEWGCIDQMSLCKQNNHFVASFAMRDIVHDIDVTFDTLGE